MNTESTSGRPKVLGVVGVRSGSKSIPHKNIKPLLGKPLLAWAIEAGKGSSYVSRIVCSTDSPAYAEIAKQYGAEIPFLRPAELAGDAVPDFHYLYHTAVWLRDHEGWQADIIVRLPATSPLVTPAHIDDCVQALLHDSAADSSRTIVAASKHPYKLWRKNGNYLEPFLSEEFTGLREAHNMPRQAFPGAFQHVDVIALRWKTLVDDKSVCGKKIRYVEIPKHEAVDIDTDIDFLVAETLLKKRMAQ